MSPIHVVAAIALGSNLGDRRAHLAFGLERLAGLPDSRLLRISSVIETEPVGTPPRLQALAPSPLGGPYLNAAALLETSLAARPLLNHLLAIEQARGRTREPANRAAPRTLDLDLLLYADLVLDEPGLTIPHPRLHERRFVLQPLAEIAPSAVHPVRHRTVAELLAGLAEVPPPARRDVR